MSAAHIVGNQAGKPAGSASLSRRDLDLGVAVFLKNDDDDGVRSHRWEMVDRPSGSVATLSSKASAVCQFTPDLPGSYLVELRVDDALPGQVDRRVFAVLTDFGGLSPRPLRIPAAREANEANWKYDFGPTTYQNTRGWMPDFVELILYSGLLAGPADTLAATLVAGNLTGGRDVVLTLGDSLRGAPGAPANVVGGSGVNGGAASLRGAPSAGPNGNGGAVVVAGGAKAGAGTDGSATVSGGALAQLVLSALGAATLSTPSGGITITAGGSVAESAGGTHTLLAQGAVSRESATGSISDTAATDYELLANEDATLAAGQELSLSGATMSASSAGTITIAAGVDIVETADGEHSVSAGACHRESTADGIEDDASGLWSARGADVSLKAGSGTLNVETEAGALTVKSASSLALSTVGGGITSITSSGSLSEFGTIVARTSTVGSLSDTSAAGCTRTASAGSVSDSASTTIVQTAGTSAARTATTGNITDTAAVNASRTATAGTITDTAGTTMAVVAPTSVTLTTPAVVLPTAGAVLRGTDSGTPTGFTVRAGNGVGGNTAGASLIVKSGDSVGSGNGTTLTLSPGAVVSGTRGRVLVTHDGPDTDEVIAFASTGTNGAAVDHLVGTQNPSAAALLGSCGDVYFRDTGSVGEAYIKSAGNSNASGWHRLGNTTLFARSNVAQTVSSTVTETTVVNFTVPGGALGTNGTLRVHAQGTFLCSAVNSSFTLRLKFGGTTIYQDVTPTFTASASLRAWVLDVTMVNVNSASSQAGGGRVEVSAVTAATTGVGALAATGSGGPIRLGTAAVDTTSDQSFLVTVEHSSNSASTQTIRTTATGVISLH